MSETTNPKSFGIGNGELVGPSVAVQIRNATQEMMMPTIWGPSAF